MKAATRSLTDPEYELFRRLVDDKSGMDIPPARRVHLEQAVSRTLEREGFDGPIALHRHLSSRAGHIELEDLIASLTVGETHFFRNRPQFEALERHVLPDLIQRRSGEKRLRIWSAGCASGEEPYSLAMLLDRMLPSIDTWNVTILATDIDRRALTNAHRATYRAWSFREVPPDIQPRYFVGRGDELELSERIRAMVTFEYLNLVEDAYPSLVSNTTAMDLIVCRNVLIYFRESTARTVIARLHRAMAEGGWLLLGHAEPSNWVADRFVVHSFPDAVAFRRSGDDVSQETREEQPAKRPAADRPRTRIPGRARPQQTHAVERPHDARLLMASAERCERAIAMRDSGDLQGALEELKQLADAHPQDPRPAYLIAKLHASRLEVEEAERWSRFAIERDLLFAPAYHLLGLMAAEAGRPDDAAAALRRCVYAEPGWPLGHFALAEVNLGTGQRRRAAAALRNVERILRDVPPEEEVREGDGVTAGRLRELATMQLEISGLNAVVERRS